MQFGLVLSAYPSREVVSSADAFNFSMKMAQAAHETGFNTLGIANKFLAGPVHQFYHPIAFAAHVLAKFPGTYITTAVLLIPYWNPVMLAEEIATLDAMAPGKLLLGVGQGYRKEEAIAFDVPDDVKAPRFTETIKALRALWSDGAHSKKTEYWEYKDADIGAKPVKAPPILIAGDRMKSIEMIPERGGDYWLPSARCSMELLRRGVEAWKRGLNKAKKPYPGMPLMRDICVGKNKAEAESILRASITDYLNRQAIAGQPGEDYTKTFDQMKDGRFILGSSEQAAEELIALQKEFQADFMLFRVYTPGMDTERALDVVRQVGSEVLPMVQKECGKQWMFD